MTGLESTAGGTVNVGAAGAGDDDAAVVVGVLVFAPVSFRIPASPAIRESLWSDTSPRHETAGSGRGGAEGILTQIRHGASKT